MIEMDMKILIGNIFETKAKTIVNTVNCVGIMGKGIALEFKKRYPAMYDDYKYRCTKKLLKPGCPYFYSDLLGTSIVNFPTKDDWRQQSNIDYIIKGLEWFKDNYEKYNIESIAFPPLGCGNGGLLWEDVGPIMYQYLKDLPIDIEIYAPFGTNREHLNIEFLSNNKDIKRKIGKKIERFNKETFCILEIIYNLNNNRYSNYIGRVMYQKLCYFATREGLKTDFVFRQNYYGPYSDKAKDAFVNFSNLNLIYEEKKGNMEAIIISKSFDEYRAKYKELFWENKRIIDRIIDLFARIKSTNQAELYSTITFAYDEVKYKNIDNITNYIISWKKTWNNEERLSDIKQGIADLNDIGYIKTIC